MYGLKQRENLIPNTVNPSPDYFCTWQVQLYATNDGKPDIQRHAINETSLFGTDKPYGWAYFYEEARRDLIFVMDSSWDVPNDDKDNIFRGSHILNREKFPSFTGDGISPSESFGRLVGKMKSIGWKGLGGWVASQECERYLKDGDTDEFWRTRLKWANDAGMSYWKVDNGHKRANFDFRKKLAEDAHKVAPNLYLENAVNDNVIPYSDVFRTYDVPAIMSIPMTLGKIYDKRTVASPTAGFECLLNCEDEAYIAAALGFTMGIMRHPYTGCFMNGKADMSFPEMHRNIKTKQSEVTRAVHWHRIAPAFSFESRFMTCSDKMLHDTWNFEIPNDEIEEWWLTGSYFKNALSADNVLTMSAPAVICRNMELPKVEPRYDGEVPYVTASKNPNGVISVATLGRTHGRSYEIPKCDITIDGGTSDTFGIFGEYKNLIIKTSAYSPDSRILAQDLADDVSYDITESVKICEGSITIPGEIIHTVGTSAQPKDDTSEPGIIVKAVRSE